MTTDLAQPVSITQRVSRLLRCPVRAEWLWLAVVLSILGILPFSSDSDPDLWWHLRTGELVAHSGIPRHDIFSWTAHGRPWVAHEWLSELLIYEVRHWLGYGADVALFSGATVAALALVYALARRRGAGAGLLLALVILASITLALFITVRPQIFTWLFFVVFVVVIERSEAEEAAPVWLLPPLMAVWVNLHLGFAYGLMTVVLWSLARGIRRLRGEAVDLRTPLIFTALCFLAMLNPWGPAIFVYPLRYVQDRQSLSVATEWSRPSPMAPALWPYFASVGLVLLAMASRHRPRPFLVLLGLATIAVSLEAVRNIAFLALVLPLVAGPPLSAWWRSWRLGGNRGRRRRGRNSRGRGDPPEAQRPDGETHAQLPAALAAAIVLGVLGLGLLAIAASPDGIPLRAPRQRGFPSAALPMSPNNYLTLGSTANTCGVATSSTGRAPSPSSSTGGVTSIARVSSTTTQRSLAPTRGGRTSATAIRLIRCSSTSGHVWPRN